ncbi:UDP-N-acetylmuramoyl-tripeptide--D-alanyl-D-alanine ligase [bacterium]|nr:UDP-N-acetylmuramoyl-tripeptide--D-alanyl-D-alanine ligase [bacterium]
MLISKEIIERAGIEVLGKWDEWLPASVIDSRAVGKDSLFWALTGGQKDGHDFVDAAFSSGAKVVAVSNVYAQNNAARFADKVLFVMEDTLVGMQALATEIRRSVGARTLGVTGSNGKTTTRELIAAALATLGKTGRSQGNYNNHIGVPLTLLNLEGDEENLVIEMGANHVGEIARLCEIAHPEVGLITNIGDAHIGEFGGAEALKKAKGELFDSLPGVDGLAVVNLDDPNVVELGDKVTRRAGYTTTELPLDWHGALYMGTIVDQDAWSRVTIEIEGVRVKLLLPGRHWAFSAVGAAAAAIEMGADPDLAIPALGTVAPLVGRGNVLELGDGVELMDESYNSNVAAVEKLLLTLTRRPGKRIAVLGDILELGQFEQDEHARVGRIPELGSIDRIYFVGERMQFAADEADGLGHPDVVHVMEDEIDELASEIAADLEPNSGIVVKGSRRIGLERVVSGLAKARGIGQGE